MSRRKLSIFCLLALLYTPWLTASAVKPARQIARFTVWLDKLDQNLLGLELEKAPDLLVKSKSRAIAFNVQALGRLYRDQDPRFDEMHKKFRMLEDNIGEYQKWVDLDNHARESGAVDEVQARLLAKRNEARIELSKVLMSTGFLPADPSTLPYIQELREFLKNYNWKHPVADRNDILTKLIAELEEIRSFPYDFTYLEAWNGVHEFRKKMRWFSMETRGLNGLITLKPKDSECPVPGYADVVSHWIATTKYAVLPGSVTEPDFVALSPCLYVQVAKLIEDVNQVKARAELEENMSVEASHDLVPPEERAKVQAMLDDALVNNLFGRLQQELAEGFLIEPSTPADASSIVK